MKPLGELLGTLRKEGTSLPSWMMPLGAEVLSYGGVEYARKFNQNHDPQNGRFTTAGGGGGVTQESTTSSHSHTSEEQTSSHILKNPEQYIKQSFQNAKGNTECVTFAQQAGGAPVTSKWFPGEYISPDNPPPIGTWVATFVNGQYYGHVGVFNGFDDEGNLQLIDQFNKQGEVDYNTYHVKPPGYNGRISNDPSKYRVVKW